MILEQFPPLVQVILLGFSSALLVLLALWYILRLPSWLARRKKLALHRAIMQPQTPKAISAPTRAQPPNSEAVSASQATRAQAVIQQRQSQSSKPSVAGLKEVKSRRAPKGYTDFKQQRQQDPSSKLSNDRFRGANAAKTEEMKRMKATLVRQAKPKLPQQFSETDG